MCRETCCEKTSCTETWGCGARSVGLWVRGLKGRFWRRRAGLRTTGKAPALSRAGAERLAVGVPQGAEVRGYRVWLVGYRRWRPRHWWAVPPRAVALRPMHQQLLSSDQAAAYVETFNRRMLARPKRLWAVAVPVVMRYAGDLDYGQAVTRQVVRRASPHGETREA